MNGISCCWRCDFCGGELEFFPQSKSGLRCRECWRTEGKEKPVFWHRDKNGERIGVELE